MILCPLDWAMKSDMWPNIILDVPGGYFANEMNTKTEESGVKQIALHSMGGPYPIS